MILIIPIILRTVITGIIIIRTVHIILPIREIYARSEIKQFIIDFETGKVMDFDLENTELLLMKDAQLYEEYVQLPRKKKKELMFVYIRKFNEKNPLYLPETE